MESVGAGVPETASSFATMAVAEPGGGDKSLYTLVGDLFARTPEWIRHDLASKDLLVRARAEETLTAILVAALSDKAGSTWR